MTMLTLPPLSEHVVEPSIDDLKFGMRYAQVPHGRWRIEDCETCFGTGTFKMWTGVPLASEVAEWKCECVEQAMLHRWLGSKGVVRGMRVRGFSDAAWVAQTVFTEQLKAWSEPEKMVRHGVGTIITGPVNSGKDLVASLLTRSALSIGIDARQVELSFFTNAVDEWRDGQLRNWFATYLRSAPMLTLRLERGNTAGTDPSVNRPSLTLNEWGLQRVDELLTHRITNRLCTVIVTGLEPEAVDGFCRGVDPPSTTFEVVRVHSPEVYPSFAITKAELDLGITRPAVMR